MNGRKATLCIRYTTKDADESRNLTVNMQVCQVLGKKPMASDDLGITATTLVRSVAQKP